jgi:putative hemolysin
MLPHMVYSFLNPAEVYCKSLGYKSESTQTAEGEVGICVFSDNTSANEWDFLQGRQSLEWSYCTKNGYEAIHLENSEICKECTACVLPNGTKIEVTKLMGLSFEEGRCGDGRCTVGENYKICPQDCPSGGEDGYCDGITDNICDPDCKALVVEEKDSDCLKTSVTTTKKITTTTIQLCNENNICESNLGESYETCPQDCKKTSMLWVYIIIGIVMIILLVLFLTRIRGEKRIERGKQIPY